MYSNEGVALSVAVLIFYLICIAASIFILVCWWKIYAKAGKPGWAAIVPYYNNYILFEIAMGNGWLFLLLLVPLVNIVVLFMVHIKLAHAFDKGTGFGIGLVFLGIIFFPMLAFGDAEYIGAQ